MKESRSVNVWLFFAAVYGISGLFYVPVLLSGEGLSNPVNKVLVAVVAFVPSLAGIAFTYLTKEPAARRDFWRRCFCWPRRHTKMAVAALLVLPVLIIAAFNLPSWFGGTPPSLSYAPKMLSNWTLVLEFLFVELVFGALSEELGWRGYALDELQSRWSALTASLVLGLVWAFWHTPAFLIPGLAQHEMGGIFSWPYAAFVISTVAGNILHTWAYNNTGRSILVAGILMHLMANASLVFMGGLLGEFSAPKGYWVAQAVVYILAAALVAIIWGPKTLTRGQKGRLDSASLAPSAP